MTLVEIGNMIQTRREALNLLQADIAELTGLSLRTVNQIELGVGNPTLDTLKKILDVVGLDITVIIKSL